MSGRRNDLDHMGAYNFTVDIEGVLPAAPAVPIAMLVPAVNAAREAARRS